MSENATPVIQNLVRDSMQKQLSLLQSLSGKFFNVSLQIAELNQHASRRLMEESAADVRKALQIKTLGDVGVFVGEQAKTSAEKVRGYWLNVQSIATGSWANPATIQGAEATQPLATPDDGDEQQQHVEKASAHKHHDAEPHPSHLVEKMIASVVVDQAGYKEKL